MAGSDAVNGQGKSFEVRNLTFDKYPEDAIGMEGVQEGKKITGPVERCWIHHNTFLPGYCANPAESDKAEGDGSCDFKRGEYFTCAYNYFTDCHKTNLVGSSDSSLQYNLTYHHNWWHNCGSRIPLARQANIHFYNNYVSTDTTTKAKISYVHSVRANAYIFSEANYYLGCKNIADDTSKAWNNTYLGCTGTNSLVDTKTREEAVSNACTHYDGTKLDKFDTDPNLFYYNAQTKQSNCLLDDSVTARAKALQYAGCNGWGKNNPKKEGTNNGVLMELMNENTPTDVVPVPDEGVLSVDLSAPPKGVILDGSINKGSLKSTKGKGQFVTFRLAAPAKVTISGVSDSYGGPYLVAQDGTVIAQLAETVSAELDAGIYIVCVSNYSYDLKQSSISSLTFEATTNSANAKLEALDQAITAIGEVTLSSKGAIENAKTLYDSLKDEEKATFETAYPGKIATLNQAIATLSELQVENVKTLISAIGQVNENSYPSIKAARDAYNALTTEQQSSVTNYGTLTQAENDWNNVAVVSINNQITNLTDVSDWTVSKGKDTITNAKTSYETVKSAYEALTTTQQGQVNNYSKVTNGLTKIGELLNEIDFTTELSKITDASSLTKTECQSVVDLYNKLPAAQKTQYAENATYKAVIARLDELNNQSVVAIFTKGNTSLASDAGFTVNGTAGYKGTSQTFTYDGKEYNSPLKMQSSNTITFNTTTAMKVVIKLHSGGSQKILLDGTSYTANSDGIVTIDNVAAGAHTIGRDGEAWLCYVELSPAA